jgi:hypothetical protein
MAMKKIVRYCISVLTVVFLMSCQSIELVGTEEKITVQGFDLYAQKNNLQSAKKLHIYIEGDGRPWIYDRIALDPGPFDPVVLSLMQQDQSPSFYLGRPCYFQSKVSLSVQCTPDLWTRARYSKKIVDILIEALNSQSDLARYEEWILIGHSGGGTLAYLMAQELPQVKTVVAISSNLDLDAWVKKHQYAPLDWSLNPASLQNKKSIRMFYLAGGKDKNVPLELNKTFLEQINAKIIYRADYNHVCCWKKEWIQILQMISVEN